MKDMVIYPYNHDVDTILNYKNLLSNYKITGLASFKEQLGKVRKSQQKYNLEEPTQLSYALDCAQTLLLCDPVGDYLSKAYHTSIKEANNKKKEILLSKKLYQRLQLGPQELSTNGILKNQYEMSNHYETNQLLDLSIPVIAVAGLGENCSKFETQLLIKKVVSDMGYQVSCLCSNSLGSLFGMHTLPEFLFEKDFSFQEKIIHLNHYLYDLCKTQNPDVFIIGFPSGIMSLGEKEYNYFGEIPLIISNAVTIDLGILNLYYNQNVDLKYFEDLRNYCSQKYNLQIEAFCMARQRMEYSPGDKKFEFYFLEEEFIKKSFPDFSRSKYPIINLADKKASENRVQALVHLLEQNLNVV